MRILDFITHPPFQYDLCKTGHEFHFAPSEMWREWDERLRPVPTNATVLPKLPDPDAYDLIIVATREQYQRIAPSATPKVFLSHTKLHPWDARFFAALPHEVEVVYVSDHKRRTFGDLGRRGRTIPLAVDAEGEFAGYDGELASVLSVTNRYAQQGDRGYGLFREATAGLATQVVGHGNEEIPGAFPAESFEHLKEQYRRHRCYLHTDPEGRLHLATLEAMAMGMPLVTVPIGDLDGLLVHGENGFVGHSAAELREALDALLSDAELAYRIGNAGRELVRRHSRMADFLESWNALIGERARKRPARSTRTPGAAPRRGRRPLRIAINACSAAGRATGIGHYAVSLCEALAALDPGHEFLLIRGRGESLLRPHPRLREVVIERPDPMWEQLHLPSLIEDLGVDVYHNPAFGLPVVKTCALVCTVHDCIPRLFPEYSPPWLQGFFNQWAPTWLRLADRMACASAHTRHDLHHLYGVPDDKAEVVYQATDPRLRRVEDSARLAEVRARYGIERPFILSVGRVELRKNVRGLLEAFRLLCTLQGSHWQLVFAGPRDADAHDPEGILPLEGCRGDVVVTGYVPIEDLAALYSAAEVFCFPSFYEGFGRPILEALQCGAPTVTSPISSMPEVGGDAAVYASPYDPPELAQALARVLQDAGLQTNMREKGYRQAGRFTPEAYARGMVAVYEKAAGSA
jgi:glycosyltransferase involved in cell wall biosynthesis